MTGRVILAMLAALLGVVAGLGALIGTATITERSPLFLLAGLLAFCVVYSLGLLLTTRGVSSLRKRRVRVASFCTGTALIVGVFTWTALLSMGDPRLPPAPVEGQRFWELPTGSRIAYVRVPAEGRARVAPIIFLHGGPGVPDMEGDARYFGRLARDGFDVYVYDQVGRGRSSRLDDPRDYTLQRDVSDLEEIRAKIDAERVILIGHSYGGTLAAAYAASHPKHVAKIVLSSRMIPRLRRAGRACSSASPPGRSWASTLSCFRPARCSPTPSCKLTRRPPMPSLATPRWVPASTGSTTGRGRPCTAVASLRVRGSTASASTLTIIPSRPPALRMPSSCQPSPSRTSLPYLQRGAATTSRGPPLRNTWKRCPIPGYSTWTAPGTTPTRT